MVDRRAFLRIAAAAALTLHGPIVARAATGPGIRYLSACRRADGTYAIAEFDPEGVVVRTIDLPDRGHGFAVTSDGHRYVAFARSPRSFALAVDATGATEPVAFATPPDRHFYGHGIFVDRDRLLLATENDFDGGRGVVGVYDATAGFARIGEFASNGVGPHELVLMPDCRTAAIANGGIETHPDAGEAKLNLSTMAPSLTFLDVTNGDILADHRLDPSLHQLSIRHLAVDAGGLVWFGCQYEGPGADRPPLIGRAGLDAPPIMAEEPPEVRTAFENYIGSVAATPDGEFIAVSSPRGGRIVLLDRRGNFVSSTDLADGCGLAGGPATGLIATSGEGRIVALEASDPSRSLATTDVSFDNHISRIMEPA